MTFLDDLYLLRTDLAMQLFIAGFQTNQPLSNIREEAWPELAQRHAKVCFSFAEEFLKEANKTNDSSTTAKNPS